MNSKLLIETLRAIMRAAQSRDALDYKCAEALLSALDEDLRPQSVWEIWRSSFFNEQKGRDYPAECLTHVVAPTFDHAIAQHFASHERKPSRDAEGRWRVEDVCFAPSEAEANAAREVSP